MNYISLFSSAGVGCYGFQKAGFDCVATIELLEKRMQIQRYNEKCKHENGYIVGDLESIETHQQLDLAISTYFGSNKKYDIDVIMATPPCQGISVANHKKKNEIKRNSLVVESIKIIKKYVPKFFIFENVSGFPTTLCTDIDGIDKPIQEAILINLSAQFHIETQVLNLKNYGSNSSRTRTIVIGVRKDQKDTCPLLFFPDYQEEKTLKEIIGHLPRLKEMGEFSENDFFHSFRPYQLRMLPWIKATPYGKSAFDNENDYEKPHQIKDGKIVINQRKNGEKYQRQLWSNVAPCVHTRNDCLASQNTIHPEDNRVFSIRELMIMLSIPDDFNWIDPKLKINDIKDHKIKEKIRSKTEKNIRECLGESVPTGVIFNIATKIKEYLEYKPLEKNEIEYLIEKNELTDIKKLKKFINKSENIYISDLFKICELANSNRSKNAAFYTPFNVAYACIEYLPIEKEFKQKISALEPSAGSGIFAFLLAKKYPNKEVYFDCVDIDNNALLIISELSKKLNIKNLKINYIHDDFILSEKIKKSYDIIVGNPPFMKVTDRKTLNLYQKSVSFTTSTNIFTYFIEKCLKLTKNLALITPKSLLGSPDYQITRNLLNERHIVNINDFNEKAFDVRIETISFYVREKKRGDEKIFIYSYLNKNLMIKPQSYVTENDFGTWLLYRDTLFDETYKKLNFGVFKVFRDRQLTKNNTQKKGKYRVIKARNIGNGFIIEDENINRYVDDISNLAVAKFLNKDVIVIPNLTYNPRAARLPKGCITDGSAAILYPTSQYTPSDDDINYFGSKEFNRFYRVARNYGTRSLNIDSNSVKYFGIRKSI